MVQPPAAPVSTLTGPGSRARDNIGPNVQNDIQSGGLIGPTMGFRTLGQPKATEEKAKSRPIFKKRTRIRINKGINRIVGGRRVDPPNSLPWQVAVVRSDYTVACGGTILCPKFVMTAGHCSVPVGKGTRNGFIVLAGAHDINKDCKEPCSEHKIKAFHDHPNYTDLDATTDPKEPLEYSNNDFTILELASPIAMRDEAMAAHLPQKEDTGFDEKTSFLVSGWGHSKHNAEWTEDVLRAVTLPWVEDSVCKSAYAKKTYKILPPMICAGDIKSGKVDACQGDSGGPMVWLDDKTKQIKLIGVTSFGYRCAQPGFPGVYAELTTALEWVKKVIGDCNEKTCEKGMCMTFEKSNGFLKSRFFRRS